MKLLARANVKHGGEAKLDTISGQVRTITVATMVRPGEMFEIDDAQAERLIADGAAVDPKDASKEEKDSLPKDEQIRVLREQLADLEADQPGGRGPDIRAHRANQAQEEKAVEAAQAAEKGKGKGKAAEKDTEPARRVER